MRKGAGAAHLELYPLEFEHAAQDSAQPHPHIQAGNKVKAAFEQHYVPRSYESIRFINRIR